MWGKKGSKSGKDFETEIICPSISLIMFLWIITRSKFLYNLKYYVSYTQQLSIKKKQRLLLYIKTLYSVNRYVCYELVLLSRLKTIDCWIKLIFKNSESADINKYLSLSEPDLPPILMPDDGMEAFGMGSFLLFNIS